MRTAGGQEVSEDKIIIGLFANNWAEDLMSTEWNAASPAPSFWSLYDGKSPGARYPGITLASAMPGLLPTLASVHSAPCAIVASSNAQVILNSAVPKAEKMLFSNEGTFRIRVTGSLVAVRPCGWNLEDWRMCDCTAAGLIERADTLKAFHRAVLLLVEVIRFNWRNSGEMERIHGYEILAYILKRKPHLHTVDLFEMLLMLVGKTANSPTESIIANPFAYRYLILDFEVWLQRTQRSKGIFATVFRFCFD